MADKAHRQRVQGRLSAAYALLAGSADYGSPCTIIERTAHALREATPPGERTTRELLRDLAARAPVSVGADTHGEESHTARLASLLVQLYTLRQDQRGRWRDVARHLRESDAMPTLPLLPPATP